MLRTHAIGVLLLGVVAGFLDGCGWFGPSAQPSWIDGVSRDYPPDRYLLGVGQAESRPAAAERAYAAVAKVFKAQINAQSRDWESYMVVENRGKASADRRVTLDQLTSVSTDKVLENVRIMDSWFDARSGQHFAMAGMDRAQAATAVLERIAELDGIVDTQLRESRQSQDKLARVRNLKRAVKNLVVREAYNADLRVIRTTGRGLDPSYRIGELTAELEQLLASSLVISVEVAGDQTEAVRRAVMEGLVREGLPVTARRVGPEGAPGGVESGRATELLVKGRVRLWEADVPDPQFKYVRWCSDFVIVDIGSQRMVGAVSRGGREGHLTGGEAAAKALRVMQQELTSDLARTLAGYVYGDIDPPASAPPAACPRVDGQAG